MSSSSSSRYRIEMEIDEDKEDAEEKEDQMQWSIFYLGRRVIDVVSLGSYVYVGCRVILPS